MRCIVHAHEVDFSRKKREFSEGRQTGKSVFLMRVVLD